MSLKIVKAPKRASVKKIVVSPVGEIIMVCGLITTYLMPNGSLVFVNAANLY